MHPIYETYDFFKQAFYDQLTPAKQKEVANLIRAFVLDELVQIFDDKATFVSGVVAHKSDVCWAKVDYVVPSLSRCDCRSEFVCEHILTLLIHKFSQFEDQSSLLEAFDGPVSAEKKLNTDFSFEEWKEKSQEFADDVVWNLYGFDPEVQVMAYNKKVAEFLPANENKRLLYLFASTFWAIDRFWALANGGSSDKNPYFVVRKSQINDALFNNLVDIIEVLAKNPRLFEDEFYRKIVEEMRSGNFRKYVIESNVRVYVRIWSNATDEEKKREFVSLQTLERSNLKHVLVLFHLSTMAEEDRFNSVLQDFKPEASKQRFELALLEILISNGQFSYARALVLWILDHVDVPKGNSYSEEYRAMYHTIKDICYLVSSYHEHVADELYDKVLRHFLPISIYDYLEKLFEEEKYEEWLMLMTAYGYSVLDGNQKEVKQITKVAPQLLLPIYHREVEMEISYKTRQSYKYAVRSLKKLRMIYKKLNRLDEWANYSGYLENNYRRLRALQEEMRKGKIIE